MPKIVVEIKWDYPDESFWLNPDNISLALHAYCKNTGFQVSELIQTITDVEATEVDKRIAQIQLLSDEDYRKSP